MRTITSAPRAGETIEVEVPTHVSGTLAFASGAVVGITMSFDVAGHRHLPLEVYGTEGSLIVPDPNWFGGEVSFLPKGGEWEDGAGRRGPGPRASCARSGSPTWRRRSGRGGRTAPRGRWRCTCSR